MEVREAAGLDHLALTTTLLQAARRLDAVGGLWEAAEVQWWWRRDQHPEPRAGIFWLDGAAPVAAVVTTDWGDVVGLDVLRLEARSIELLDLAWPLVVARLQEIGGRIVEMTIDDADDELRAAAGGAGFVRGDEVGVTTWMDVPSRPPPAPLPAGLSLVGRDDAGDRPHHMIARNGADVAQRLAECSLYRPDLDLAVYDDDGAVAAYGLFWPDPTTGVGLVEPMRTEDAFQRRGLGGCVLTAGLERLAAAGCDRLKVTHLADNDASRRLYLGAGFTTTTTSSTWRRG